MLNTAYSCFNCQTRVAKFYGNLLALSTHCNIQGITRCLWALNSIIPTRGCALGIPPTSNDFVLHRMSRQRPHQQSRLRRRFKIKINTHNNQIQPNLIIVRLNSQTEVRCHSNYPPILFSLWIPEKYVKTKITSLVS